MSSLRSLLASFHISVDEGELKEAHENMEGFRQLLKTTGNALAEAFAVREVKEFVEGQIEAGTQLKVTAERIGVTTSELQAMQLAAGEASVSTESLSTALIYLNRNIQMALQGGGEQARVFQQLGIHVKDASGHTKSAGDVIGELADRLQSIEDPTVRANAAMTLLGRGGMDLIPLLNKGSGAIKGAREELAQLGGGLGTDFVEKAEEAEAANVRLGFAWKGLRSQLAEALFPAVKEMVEEFTKLVVAGEKLEHQTRALSTAVEFFGTIAAIKALGSLREVAKVMGILRPTTLETATAFLEFAAPIAAIALLYLLFDDIVNLLKGNDSLIGRFLGPEKAQFVKDINEALSSLLDTMANLGKIIWNALLIPLEGAFDALKGIGQALGDIAGGNFKEAWSDLKKSGDEMTSDANKRIAALSQAGSRLGDDFTLSAKGREEKYGQTDAFGLLPSSIKPRVMKSFERVTPHVRPHHALAHATGGHGGVVIHQQNHTEVKVSGAKDPHATGKAVSRGVSTAQERANERARTALRKP